MHKRFCRGVTLAFVLILFVLLTTAQPEKALPTAAKPEGVALPVIMYHQLSRNSGCWNDYVLSPEKFEADLQTLAAMGYTPVSVKQLIAYTTGRGSLPERPVLLTFDDGDENFYNIVFPMIKKYNTPVVLSPVAEWVERSTASKDPQLSYVTLPQVREMGQSGLVEIENHTYGLHSYGRARKGVLMNHGESLAQYRNALVSDIGRAQLLWQKAVGQAPVVFTYPYGFYNDNSEAVMRTLGFKVTLTCYEKVNRILGPESLYRLGRYNRPNCLSSEAFFSRINKLVEKVNTVKQK